MVESLWYRSKLGGGVVSGGRVSLGVGVIWGVESLWWRSNLGGGVVSGVRVSLGVGVVTDDGVILGVGVITIAE